MDTEAMCDRRSVKTKVSSWFHRKKFYPEKLRGILIGLIITTTIGEVTAYKLLLQDVRGGQLPQYITDVFIVLFSIFEAIIAPIASWWGYRRRRILLQGYTVACIFCCFIWFGLPEGKGREESGFCDAANGNNSLEYTGTSGSTVARLVLIIIAVLVFVTSRVAFWCHSFAYCDEYAPARTSVHYGGVLIARMVSLILGHKILTTLADSNMTFQILTILPGFLISLVQLLFVVPLTAPIVDGVQKVALPSEGRSLLMSVGRVFYNAVAMSQVFAMGLLVAALWGYGYHELDIIKVKFNLIPSTSVMAGFTEIMLYYFIIAVVGYAGVKFSAPCLMEFCNLKAIKHTVLMSVACFVFIIVLTTAPRCDRGDVAGLGRSYYGHPECSLSCHCKPRWNEFEPVCVTDTMVTYVSPCHAGCSDSEVINGIQVFTNCSCSATGQAVAGACSDTNCLPAYRFHCMIFFIIVTFTLLALQSQGVTLLRIVDPRDKAVVLGIAWSMIALIAFVCGHLVFQGVRVANCGWYEAEKCHLQNQAFPYLVGATSAFLALTSIMTSITTWICIKMVNKTNAQTTFETSL